MFSRAKEQSGADTFPARYAFERDWIGIVEMKPQPKPKKWASPTGSGAVNRTARERSERI
jgi:hypothetical protein